MNCKDCGQPMLHVFCDDCDARGYWWRPDGFGGWRAIPCGHCGETGRRWHCTNTNCPGITWYPLSRADSSILRMAQRNVSEDEKLRS